MPLTPSEQARHPLLPDASPSEESRQLFARDLRRHVMYRLFGHLKQVYDREVAPGFQAASGRGFASRAELREQMYAQGFMRATESVQRVSQELIWASVVPVAERQADSINARVRELSAAPRHGSLHLDPSVKVPEYVSRVDIHCMPGNYHGEFTRDDASQGAVFDRGGFLYNLCLMGPYNDAIGRLLAAEIRQRFPDLQPRRILDMGCTMGHQTLPFCDAFPDAEVHALDVAAPMLRYAHARAEALGKAVHWHQMDATATGFPDSHFDLVVSNIMLHETCAEAVPKIFAECHRLLRPGGVMAHIDIPDYNRYPDLLFQVVVDADRFHNNEPFWGELHDLDLVGLAAEAGFPQDGIAKGIAPMDTLAWSLLTARKAGA